MSTVWRKTMIALGLGDDEDYEDYDDEFTPRAPAPGVPPSPAPSPQHPPAQPRSVQPVADRTASVSPLPGVPAPEGGQTRFPTHGGPHEQPPVRTVAASDQASAPGPDPGRSAPSESVARSGVRTIARPTATPYVVAPRSFDDAATMADHFKDKEPVIVNLQGVERDLSRRLVDFASGLCYGLGGQMKKVATDVFLLTPTDVEVSAEERQRLSERGLYDS
ncbi:MAG: cell division protein SepF [Acidimicrobiales bacterium]